MCVCVCVCVCSFFNGFCVVCWHSVRTDCVLAVADRRLWETCHHVGQHVHHICEFSCNWCCALRKGKRVPCSWSPAMRVMMGGWMLHHHHHPPPPLQYWIVDTEENIFLVVNLNEVGRLNSTRLRSLSFPYTSLGSMCVYVCIPVPKRQCTLGTRLYAFMCWFP